MARSRMIKPEFWDDEKLAKNVSIPARLVFIGLWNHSDDYGVVKGNSMWLKNHILPYDDSVSPQDFSGWLTELSLINCIIPFESGGEKFYYIRTFLTHQKVNRASKQRNPAPPSDIIEPSRSAHGIITEGSGKKLEPSEHLQDERAYARTHTRKTETETETETEINTPEAPEPDQEKKAGSSPSGFFLKKASKTIPFPVVPKKRDGYHNIKDCSDLFQGINSACDQITALPPKPKPFIPQQWAQASLKTGAHPGAVMETLQGLSLFWNSAEDPWGMCNKILKTKNGNWNEKDAIAIHQEFKSIKPGELEFLTNGLFQGVS